MTLKLSTVTAALAAVAIPGVRVLDKDEIPAALTARDTPVLLPDPANGLVSNFAVRVNSFGMSAERRYTVTYDLNYLLAVSMTGLDRAMTLDWYSRLYTLAFTCIDALLAADVAGSADLVVKTVSKPVGITDAAGNKLNAIYLTLTVTELVN